MFEKIKIAEGVNLYIRPTTQFKTISFSFKFRTALTKQSASERTVLSNVLQHSNAVYKTNAAYRSALDDLYGAVLYFDTGKKGTQHAFYMNAEVVNEQYLAEDRVLDKMMTMMQTALLQPNLQDGIFLDNIVAREKQIVTERIEAVFDDKTRYAQHRLMQILRPQGAASISANGTVQDVATITATSLYETYQNMLSKDTIDIYIVGDVDVREMAARIQSHFAFTDRMPYTQTIEQVAPQPFDYVREQQVMKQGKLHMGFSTPVAFGDDRFPVMQVLNGVFGGYAHSKLFMNVREKESLAYYASSSYLSHYSLLFVTSGIEPENEDKAYQLIQQQLQAICDGQITARELQQTKAQLKNQLREALDVARGQIEVYDQYKSLKEPFTVENWSAKWEAVTAQEISELAAQIKLQAVYFLSGKGE